MKTTLKAAALFTGLLILLTSFAACTTGSGAATAPTTTATSEPDSSATEEATTAAVATDDTPLRVAVLNGTTGFGIAPLYRDLSEGKVDDLNLTIDFYTDATLVSPLIISGTADVAAVPTNLASVLYNKTNGGIRVLAVNTLGVLYLIENGETVHCLADLSGKTVYLPGQGTNPEYVFRALLRASGGAELESSVTFDYSYPSPDELTTAAATGKASLAVLPEPKVTAATMKNASLRVAVDFTDEWKKATGTELVQGCVIVRSEYADAHPGIIEKFMQRYEGSVTKAASDIDGAANDIVFAGIAPKEQLVKNALPKCNLVFLTGKTMEDSLSAFWGALYNIIPSSVGGKLPDGGIFQKISE
ncbi:MAG: ABC transporter substrate-binding protein [Clostridia bacterium]|nr:ABC transporter substrate-binding protein [Clostridia bacterium]